MKDKMWEGKPYNVNGVLTPEMIDEAAKIVAEESGYHPCRDGHRLIPVVHSVYNAGCTFCGELFKLDKK